MVGPKAQKFGCSNYLPFDGQCEWVTRIDIEDVLFDLNVWPDRISANFRENNAIGFFHDGKEKTLDIVQWIINDGVSRVSRNNVSWKNVFPRQQKSAS